MNACANMAPSMYGATAQTSLITSGEQVWNVQYKHVEHVCCYSRTLQREEHRGTVLYAEIARMFHVLVPC